MAWQFEQLEGRDVPATFVFHFDATVPESYKPAIEQAGVFVGSHLGRQDVIDVPITRLPLGSDTIARGAPRLGILLGSERDFYTGTDTAGLGYGQFDLFTITIHELGHVLGYLYHLDAPNVLSAYAPSGRRLYYTTADWRALDSLGWQVEDRVLNPRDLYFVSVLGGDGWCRQYVVGPVGVFQVGAFFGYHLTLEDVDQDGIHDFRFTPATTLPQLTGAVSGKDYSLVDGPRITTGTSLVVTRI